MWRTAAILAPVPLAALVMACVSPAASSDDHSPVLERGMYLASKVATGEAPASKGVGSPMPRREPHTWLTGCAVARPMYGCRACSVGQTQLLDWRVATFLGDPSLGWF